MSTIVIKYDGDDITDSVVFSQSMFRAVADGTPGTFQLVIDDPAHVFANDYFHAGGTMELFIDGDRAWDGWVFTIGRAWPFDADDTVRNRTVPRFWKLSGYDRNLLLQKRVMYRLSNPDNDQGLKIWPADTPDRTALEYVLEHYVDLSGDGITWDIEQVGSPGPFEEFTLGFVSAPLGVAFEDCSEITGALYFIGPDRVGRYVDDMTPTAPFVLSDVKGAGKVTYREVMANLDYTEAANEALVWGAGKGSDDAVFAKYTDSGSVSTHGLWQWGDLFIGAWKQKTVERRARTYVEGSPSHRRGHSEPVPSVTCSIFEPGLRAGHVVTFEMDQFGYSQALPVRSVNMTFITQNAIRYDVEMSLKIDTPHGVPNLWPDPPWENDGGGGGGQWYPDPPTPGTSTDTLIDHYDRDIQVWTNKVVDLYPKRQWQIQWPIVPDGVQPTDLLMIVWTRRSHNPLPGTPEFYWPDGENPTYFPVQSNLHPDGTWNFLCQSDDFESHVQVFGSYVIPGEDMDLSSVTLNMNPSCEYDTYVGYVSIVVRGFTGPTDPVVGNNFTLDLASNYNEPLEINELTIADYREDLAGGDSYLYFAFGARGGFGDSHIFEDYVLSGEYTYEPDEDWELLEVYNAGYVGDSPATPTSFALAMKPSTSDYNVWAAFHDNYPNGGVYADGATIVWAIKMQDVGNLGSTPGPDVTGSGYPGGNEYSVTTTGSGTYVVKDSYLSLKNDLIYLFATLEGSHYSIPSGTLVEAQPDAAFSGGRWIMKARFQFAGPEVAKDQTFDVTMHGIDLETMTGWDVECFIRYHGQGCIHDTGWEIYFDPAAGIVHEDYAAELLALPAASDDWFYVVVDFGVSGFTRMKFWRETEIEPDWRYSFENKTYDLVTGDGYWGGASTAWDTFGISLANYMFPSTNDSIMRLDAIWSVGSATGQGGTVLEVPIHDGEEDGESGTYHTQYPYEPGSLVVWFQGIRLREGIDYIETDPATGSFRILDDRDLSAGLYVTYRRAGSSGTTGGQVYRPAPVLQYGWGTVLDGLNCMMACSVMALDRHTQGAHTPFVGTPRSTPPMHRYYQYDQTGGTDITDVWTAWDRGWGETFWPVGVTTFGHFCDLINEGRGAIVAGMYSSLPSSKRHSETWTGPHAIYINEQFENGNFWGYDPLYRYPIIYTAGELMAYGASIAGTGNIQAGFTRVTT